MYKYVWMDGNLIEHENAYVHIGCLGFLMGMSVFEAVRIYIDRAQSSVHCFRLDDHLNRLYNSLKINRMKLEYEAQDIVNAVKELIRVNDVCTNAYLRLTVYCKSPSPGSSIFNPENVDYGLIITISEKKNEIELDEIKCQVSSWRRINDNCIPPRIKAVANYQNTRLAGYEAVLNGYDNCIFLNEWGKVSEAGESAIFLVKNETLITPDRNSDILESITRDTVINIAEKVLGIRVEERSVDRTELYTADEVFLANTARLIRPVIEIDNYCIGCGKAGRTTYRIYQEFVKVVNRENELNPKWYLSNIISK